MALAQGDAPPVEGGESLLDHGIQGCLADAAGVAGGAAFGVGAGAGVIAVGGAGAYRVEAGATAGAAQEAGQEVHGGVGSPGGLVVGAGAGLLQLLGPGPVGRRDNGWEYVLPHHVWFAVPALAIHEVALVGGVIQYVFNRRDVPEAACTEGEAFAVQGVGKQGGAVAVLVQGVEAPDYGGLVLDDGEGARLLAGGVAVGGH